MENGLVGCVFDTIRLYQSVLKHFKEHNFCSSVVTVGDISRSILLMVIFIAQIIRHLLVLFLLFLFFYFYSIGISVKTVSICGRLYSAVVSLLG